MSQLFFSREVDDVPIHFQIIRLEKQAYVWVAAGTPNMSSLYAAMPTKLDTLPSATTLLPGSGDLQSLAMAQRIVRKSGVPVVLSVNLPAEADRLRQVAEVEICKALANEGGA